MGLVLGTVAVFVPHSQMEVVGLSSWQQSCSMVLHCSTKPPWRGRGWEHHQPFPDSQNRDGHHLPRST